MCRYIYIYIHIYVYQSLKIICFPSMATILKQLLLRQYYDLPGQHARAASQKRHRAENPESHGIS